MTSSMLKPYFFFRSVKKRSTLISRNGKITASITAKSLCVSAWKALRQHSEHVLFNKCKSHGMCTKARRLKCKSVRD